MFKELIDKQMPEIKPGKYLYPGLPWNSYCYLVDAKTKSHLVWVSKIVFVLSLTGLLFLSFVTKGSVGEGTIFTRIILLCLAILLPFMLVSRLLVRGGEKIDKKHVNPKLLPTRSKALKMLWDLWSPARWARWVVITVVIFVCIGTTFDTAGIIWVVSHGYLSQGYVPKPTFIVRYVIEIVVLWRCVAELRSRRGKARSGNAG